jgi:hypothetical protein
VKILFLLNGQVWVPWRLQRDIAGTPHASW